MRMESIEGGCPLCGSKKSRLCGTPKKNELFANSFDDVRVMQCTGCAHFYAHPMPTFSPELLQKMYAGEYFPQYTARWHAIRNIQNPVRRFDTAQRLCQRPIKRFLEIGCGEGHGLRAALGKGWEVWGQDISVEFAGRIREQLKISIQTDPISTTSFPPSHFDLVYIDSVLEHVQDPVAFLRLVMSFVVPGGGVYLIVPNESALPVSLRNLGYRVNGSKHTARLCPFSEPYHLVGFSKRSIRFLARCVGADIAVLTCDRSYAHVRKFHTQHSFAGQVSRRLWGWVNVIADVFQAGINLETLMIKEARN